MAAFTIAISTSILLKCCLVARLNLLLDVIVVGLKKSMTYETGDEFSKRNSGNKIFKPKWSQEDIKVVPTNAYGVIEFHGAGKRTRAKVQCIWVAYDITY